MFDVALATIDFVVVIGCCFFVVVDVVVVDVDIVMIVVVFIMQSNTYLMKSFFVF